ncbi:aminotransferase class IV [Mangrovicoccus algicola]|uniref:Probable branched-chain-amino-acid aminotransferase n=1 Tax=Mangrovicoccus algicola TaxID=2771008 RepID=A0A8J6YV70_9RHOB|nr:aminotransferase class IV [Mangrovicoccus algicola]MBE3638395.1 aminotransferase class IV [Mangrovicoccus algicola]
MRWWAEGRLLEGPVAPFDLTDRGLLLGDALFDTAMVVRGRVVRGSAHLDRLAAGCATLGLPFGRARAQEAWSEVCAGLAAGSVRLTVTRGSGPRGVLPPENPVPRLFASAAPGLPPPFAPLRLATAAIRRNDTSPAAQLKTPGYLDAVLATRAAREAGADEPLFLNTRGRVACAGIGNLMMILGDRLVTPPPAEGILPGILRAELLSLAPSAGLRAEERPVEPAELPGAAALLVTNSLRLASPVTHLDGRAQPPLPAAAHALFGALARALAPETGPLAVPSMEDLP